MSKAAKSNDPNPIRRIVSSKIILICAVLAAIAALFLLSALLHSSFTKQPKTIYSTPSPSPSLAPSFAPTLTLAPGQKAIYTFYVQATSHKTSNEELTLNMSDTGKIHTADIGTLIIVNFGRVGKFHMSASSPQAIFTNFGRPETIHLPNNSLGAFRVYRSGLGTITVIETE